VIAIINAKIYYKLPSYSKCKFDIILIFKEIYHIIFILFKLFIKTLIFFEKILHLKKIIDGGKKMRKIFSILILGLLILSGGITSAISLNKSNIKSSCNVNDEYDMIIIAPEEFSSEIQPLINHKNSYDIKTHLKTTQEIYQEFSGRDEPEQIKYFIKQVKEQNNISFVLLIGGRVGNKNEWYVPVRYVELDDGTGRFKKHISDLYYADLYKDEDDFEDWDSNEDDIIAQWPKDRFDLFPDVYIGRLPCRNENEVSTVVQKIIDYETKSYGQFWFNRFVAVGGDTFTDYSGYEGEITCDFAADYMNGFDILKLYSSTGALTGSTELKNAINNGCGFLFTRAKGGTDRIRVNFPEGAEFIALNNNDISDLTNKDKYPVIILGECQHGQFDIARMRVRNRLFYFSTLIDQIFDWFFSLFEKKETMNPVKNTLKECIAWKLINKKDGGGIAVFTNTNICFAAIGDANSNGIPDDVEQLGGQLAVEVLRLYNQENIDKLGEIHGRTVEDYVSIHPVKTNKIHCKSVQEWILLGDPSLKIGGYE
jgi:hypothetical protein